MSARRALHDAEEEGRRHVDNVLENTHESLKWSWLVVMGFALSTAVQENYFAYKGCFLLEEATISVGEFVLRTAIFVLVFMPTFVRFFYGDNRYLDQRYSELRQLRDEKLYIDELRKTFSPACRWIDIALLLFHGVVFAILAQTINSPEVFFWVYAGLLVTNCLWLLTSPKLEREPWFWIQNNAWHVWLFLVVLAIWLPLGLDQNREFFLSAYVALSLTNSILDLYLMRTFYQPPLDVAYEEAKARFVQGESELRPDEDQPGPLEKILKPSLPTTS